MFKRKGIILIAIVAASIVGFYLWFKGHLTDPHVTIPSVAKGATANFSFWGFSPNSALTVSIGHVRLVGGGSVPKMTSWLGTGNGSFLVGNNVPAHSVFEVLDANGKFAQATFTVS